MITLPANDANSRATSATGVLRSPPGYITEIVQNSQLLGHPRVAKRIPPEWSLRWNRSFEPRPGVLRFPYEDHVSVPLRLLGHLRHVRAPSATVVPRSRKRHDSPPRRPAPGPPRSSAAPGGPRHILRPVRRKHRPFIMILKRPQGGTLLPPREING